MSLSDALLLDPYPFEAWVALRSSKGSGTLNDPFGVTTAGGDSEQYHPVDNGSDVNGYSRAMEIYRVKDVLIENNILRTDKDDAATQARAIAYLTTESSIRTSSNWTPAGSLVRGAQYVVPHALAPELETTVSSDLEDALLASFLGGNL